MATTVKKWLQKTPNTLFCVLGAAAFFLVFYLLAYRTLPTQVWMAPNIDNDEVIYNRQVVSVLTHGGPQGYFGYQESHADIGRYGTWGPLLIWAYALPGVLFGAGVNTVFFCNLLFTVAGIAVFARAARLAVWQCGVFAATLVCAWAPLSAAVSGGSEPLHYALCFCVAGAAAALGRGFSRGWLALAVVACALETIFRPYALLLWVFPLAAVWRYGRRPRAVCLAAAPVSFAAALFSMTKLSAPYFSGGGMDFGALRLLAQADVAGAVQHALAHAAKEWHTAWAGGILPTLQGNAQYVGVGCVVFAVMAAVTAACLAYDLRRGRPCRLKLCALGFALAVALVLLFMYNIAPRHLTLLCVLLLAALVAEDAPRAVVWLPVLAVLLLPLQAQRSTLSTWFPEMGDQVAAVEAALTESLQARASADPWDNTLAYAYDDGVYHGYLYGVPAGMGIEFDFNTYLADAANPIRSRYAMVGHGTDAEARLLADGWQELVSTEELIVYERPDAARE